MKSVGKARNNGLYRHIRTSKEIIRNLLNDSKENKKSEPFSYREKVRIFMVWCDGRDSNPRPTDS